MNSEANAGMLVVGLMSGTSVDGIDAVLVETNGEQLTCLARSTSDYNAETRNAILTAYEEPEGFLQDTSATAKLSTLIAEDHANAVNTILRDVNRPVQLLGFHGQTVLHQPELGKTVQLGDANILSKLTKINTVHNFRQADINAGGQGAPLAPIYHVALIQQAKLALPTVMLNIGGVANLTYYDGEQLLGFDTGPGNGLIDQYMQRYLQCAFDNNGELAAQGAVEQSLVDAFLTQEYFGSVVPKSLDRSSFNHVLDSVQLQKLDHADAMATLVALTVGSVKRSIDQINQLNKLAQPPRQVVVCGGGQHNGLLVSELQAALSASVVTADSLRLSGDYIEAELMALLAVRHHYNLPSTFPETTGVSAPCVAGELCVVSDNA